MNHDLFYQAANTRALGSDRVPEVWSVSQVTALARQLLEGSIPVLTVAGEISGFRRRPAGHCFFTLKDRRSRLECVMWREAARRLPTEPPEGLAVRAVGRPSVYERAGRLQLVVSELQAEGEGLWRLAFERVRKRLEADGLLEASRKRRLPPYPECVGVVTSVESAALRDIISVIRRRAPWVHVRVYPARVQGDGASMSIVEALRHADHDAEAQVLIVGRGGGSVEDLWVFNDERIARAIAATAVPVVSAVGHETDLTLADLVADHRAPTPSAAAEAAVPDGAALRRHLARVRQRLPTAAAARVSRAGERLSLMERRLLRALDQGLERRRLRLEALSRRLHALGPMEVLKRGYALAVDAQGRVLRRTTQFTPGMVFDLRLQDGTVRARTDEAGQQDGAGRTEE